MKPVIRRQALTVTGIEFANMMFPPLRSRVELCGQFTPRMLVRYFTKFRPKRQPEPKFRALSAPLTDGWKAGRYGAAFRESGFAIIGPEIDPVISGLGPATP